jgi:hypothetical protein
MGQSIRCRSDKSKELNVPNRCPELLHGETVESWLDFEHFFGFKASRNLVGITALIAENSRSPDFIVHVVMRMAVNPQWNTAALNHQIQIRSKCGAQRLAYVVRWD